MSQYLYKKEFTCPVCENKFQSSVVRNSMVRLAKRDTDLFRYYKNINPYYYEIKVCPRCGFAFSEHSTLGLDYEVKKNFYNSVSKHWNSVDYCGERSLKEAIATFKLALLAAQITNEKLSVRGNYCLRLCWLNRLDENHEEEMRFMKSAFSAFEESYQTEDNKGIKVMKPEVMLYMLGELSFRLQNYADTKKWFSIALGECTKNPFIDAKIKDIIRDRWMDIKYEIFHENHENI
ncbi:hypothetical protein OXPF_27610 [Oxobacter pfennigii]|uniref:DUF2225 domain-containing protein n=1 Tax=Oxobacter pfennigii TaxID=36849 RepID=A0A0N8NSY4_9CLOT|nr:DUF2225 domain-containing protein [Oxobacter pfennigii]KPU43320.1 hypothetical protein OXPF_27610 [Oxobacter pfennigii]